MIDMNRRSFIGTLATALAAFTVLPSATTYQRNWVTTKTGMIVPNPEWMDAPLEVAYFFPEAGIIKQAVLKRDEPLLATIRSQFQMYDHFPIRYKMSPSGERIFVPPFIEI